jgi:C4-type Zn-finger protein
MNFIEQYVDRQILKMCAAQTVFCPICEKVLDMKHTVNVEILLDGKVTQDVTLCATCFDKSKDSLNTRLSENLELSSRIYDGRKAWSKKT